jgi:hypothetical protein
MTQDGVAVWLGIDWADEKHSWAMRIDGETRVHKGELEHTPEAVEQFVSGLAARFPGRQIAVALEQSRGALIFMLGKYRIWFFIRSTRTPWITIVRARFHRALRVTLAMQCWFWISNTGMRKDCVPSIQTQWRRARCSCWLKHAARPSMTRRVISTG